MLLDPDLYLPLVTVHVVLFAYWLGGDFGVHVCSRHIGRSDLPLPVVGLWLRTSIGAWRIGFRRLQSGDDGAATAAVFSDSLRRGQFIAYFYWTLIITMAWLGITKPF